jgi:ParB-like nuclease domain
VGDDASQVAEANRLAREAAAALPWTGQPVAAVQWVPADQVHANDYNPNAVAPHELRLLVRSIEADGFTQPVVVIRDDEHDRWVIVDGFHRATVLTRHRHIAERTGGYLPVVVIDKPLADRMASTVRHNRARGKHSVAGMSSLVFDMLAQGEADEAVCDKLGLEAEELARLKHITGFAKLYADHEYGRPSLTESQLKAKGEYAAAHPDEEVPTHI